MDGLDGDGEDKPEGVSGVLAEPLLPMSMANTDSVVDSLTFGGEIDASIVVVKLDWDPSTLERFAEDLVAFMRELAEELRVVGMIEHTHHNTALERLVFTSK